MQDLNPTVTAADLLEKNLDTALKELQHSKANHREMATQLWDLRRQLADAKKYFEKTLHQYEEEANFNTQHLRRSYEEQIDFLKAEAKKANRMMEQALNRHSTGTQQQDWPTLIPTPMPDSAIRHRSRPQFHG